MCVCVCLRMYVVFSGDTCLTFTRHLFVHPCVCHVRWPVSLKRFCSVLTPFCNRGIRLQSCYHIQLYLGLGISALVLMLLASPLLSHIFSPLTRDHEMQQDIGRHILFDEVQHQSVSSRLGNFGFLSFRMIPLQQWRHQLDLEEEEDINKDRKEVRHVLKHRHYGGIQEGQNTISSLFKEVFSFSFLFKEPTIFWCIAFQGHQQQTSVRLLCDGFL